MKTFASGEPYTTHDAVLPESRVFFRFGDCKRMKFLDEVDLKVRSGDGGKGIVAWRKEKYVPKGGRRGGMAAMGDRSTSKPTRTCTP